MRLSIVMLSAMTVACSETEAVPGGETEAVPGGKPEGSPSKTTVAPAPAAVAARGFKKLDATNSVDIRELENVAEAIKAAMPFMSDSIDVTSRGAQLLAMWASPRMELSDVLVRKNETSIKLVKKDSDAARGNVCAYRDGFSRSRS